MTPEEHKDKIKEYNKQYRVNNLENLREKERAYYYANREKCRERQKLNYHYKKTIYSKQRKEYREANIEKIRDRERLYREKNPEKRKEAQRKCYANKPEKYAETKKVYAQKNSAKLKKYKSNWYYANRDRSRSNMKKWRQENPNNVRLLRQKRRARKRNALGDFSLADWNNIKQQYNFTCPACGIKEPEIKLTIDHIIPLIRGGRHDKSNIQPLCKSCNCSKQTKVAKWNPKGQLELIL